MFFTNGSRSARATSPTFRSLRRASIKCSNKQYVPNRAFRGTMLCSPADRLRGNFVGAARLRVVEFLDRCVLGAGHRVAAARKARPRPGSLSKLRRCVDLLLLTGLVVALLTALTRLLRLLTGLLILPALLLTALARVLRLLTRLLIVAALILLAALARIVHWTTSLGLCSKNNAGKRDSFRSAVPGKPGVGGSIVEAFRGRSEKFRRRSISTAAHHPKTS
jgi:hypothetical protein